MNRPPIIAKPRENTGLGMLLLGGLGALGIGVVLFLFDPAAHGFYPRCQFHAWTGLYCPGCGSLRALHQLAHGHLGTALGSNPLLILALPLFAWAVVARLLSRAGRCGLSLNLPDWVGTRSTASLTFPRKNGTRWNASLPGSWAVGGSVRNRGLSMNLKLERRHVAGLNRALGKSAQVSAIGHGKATPVAVSRLQVGAPWRKPALQWLVLAVVLGFTVLRNIPIAPFTWLAP